MKHLLQTFTFLGVVLFLTTACTGGKKGKIDNSKVFFRSSNSLSEVLETAKKENKVVFVDMVTDWCMPCKLMDEEVFSHPETAAYMNKNFINYKVDAEKDNGPMVSLVYQVEAFPTLLFVDGEGKILVRKEGMAFHTELKSLAEEALAMVQ